MVFRDVKYFYNNKRRLDVQPPFVSLVMLCSSRGAKFSIQNLEFRILLNHLHTTLDELAEGFTLEHTVTQEGKVDELVEHLVVLGKV